MADLSYTEASRELDEIVAFFEQREVDVDQLVARLERATAIVDELDRRLRRTRAQVEELVPRLAAATALSRRRATTERRLDGRARRGRRAGRRDPTQVVEAARRGRGVDPARRSSGSATMPDGRPRPVLMDGRRDGPPLLPPAPLGAGLRPRRPGGPPDGQLRLPRRRPGDRGGAARRSGLCAWTTCSTSLAADGMRCVGRPGDPLPPRPRGRSDRRAGPSKGWPPLLERVQVPVHVQRDEVPWVERTTGVGAEHLVAHDSGDVVDGRARSRSSCVHTPGHTPGSQCFLVDGRLVSGDTLFLDGCGRTDLPGSDPAAMYESLTTRLARVPDDAVLFPGHLYSPEPSAADGRDPTDQLRLPTPLGRRSGWPCSASELPVHGRPGRCPPTARWWSSGASLAGLRAAEALRAEGFAGRLVLVGEELAPPLRPTAPLQAGAGGHLAARASRCWPMTPSCTSSGWRCTFGRRAVSLDAEARRVELDDGSVLEADGVVVATGARPRRLPGTEGLDGVTCCARSTTAEALRARLPAAGPGLPGGGGRGRVHRLGGGVHLRRPRVPGHGGRGPGHPAGPGAGRGGRGGACGVHARRQRRRPAHRRRGRDGRTRPAATTRTGALPVGSSWPTARSLAADVVVVGIGVVPERASGWRARGSTVDNGVVCDAALFAADGVVAAGDLARWPWRHHGRRSSSGSSTGRWPPQMGEAAARSLLAGRAAAPAFDPVPYFWSDQYGLRIQMLGRPDARRRGGGGRRLARRRGRLRRPLRPVGPADRRPGVSRPRQLMAFRPLLVAGASFDDALALLDQA